MPCRLQIDEHSQTPMYRQLYEQLKSAIGAGRMVRGEKLAPTRELAGSLGLNRTTVAAAYGLLESEGLIRGHVGRGSFVEGSPAEETSRLDWEALLDSNSSSEDTRLEAPFEESISDARDHLDAPSI